MANQPSDSDAPYSAARPPIRVVYERRRRRQAIPVQETISAPNGHHGTTPSAGQTTANLSAASNGRPPIQVAQNNSEDQMSNLSAVAATSASSAIPMCAQNNGEDQTLNLSAIAANSVSSAIPGQTQPSENNGQGEMSNLSAIASTSAPSAIPGQTQSAQNNGQGQMSSLSVIPASSAPSTIPCQTGAPQETSSSDISGLTMPHLLPMSAQSSGQSHDISFQEIVSSEIVAARTTQQLFPPSDSAQNTGQTHHVSIQETASSSAQTASNSKTLDLGLRLSLPSLPKLNTDGGSRSHDDDQDHASDEVTLEPESEYAYWRLSLSERGSPALETVVVYENLIAVIGVSNLIKWNANWKNFYLRREEVIDKENFLVAEKIDLEDLYVTLSSQGSHIMDGPTTDQAISSIQKKRKAEAFDWTAFPSVNQSLAMRYPRQLNLIEDDLNRDNLMELEQKWTHYYEKLKNHHNKELAVLKNKIALDIEKSNMILEENEVLKRAIKDSFQKSSAALLLAAGI